MKLEWDEEKRIANIAKHDVDFRDAATLFKHPFLHMEDNRRDYGEKRYVAIGQIEGRVMVIAFTIREDKIRIISLRKANKREQEKYKKSILDRLEKN